MILLEMFNDSKIGCSIILILATCSILAVAALIWTRTCCDTKIDVEIEYQSGYVDTLHLPVGNFRLKNSCVEDEFDGRQYVCGVRKFEILNGNSVGKSYCE